MNVRYRVEKLTGFFEVDLSTVAFETIEACPVCHARDAIDVSQLNASLITAWCGRCHHLFHRRRPTPEWYERWYASSWDRGRRNAPRPPSGLGRLARRAKAVLPQPVKDTAKWALGRPLPDPYLTADSIYGFCRPAVGAGARVLDIGCGYGGHLEPFLLHGCTGFGIEASAHRSAAAEQRGIRTANVPVERLDVNTFSTSFDLVFSNHVLEHVCDPHGFVAAVRRVLVPGGWLCLTVPNLDNDFLLQDFFYSLHIHCFSRTSLTSLLERHGFVVRRVTEDHQIRLLAQAVGDGERAGAPPRPSARWSEGAEVPTEWILRRSLGDAYASGAGRPVFCTWTPYRDPLDRLHARVFQDRCDLSHNHVVRLTWDGPPKLPLWFDSEQRADGAPFWVQ